MHNISGLDVKVRNGERKMGRSLTFFHIFKTCTSEVFSKQKSSRKHSVFPLLCSALGVLLLANFTFKEHFLWKPLLKNVSLLREIAQFHGFMV